MFDTVMHTLITEAVAVGAVVTGWLSHSVFITSIKKELAVLKADLFPTPALAPAQPPVTPNA